MRCRFEFVGDSVFPEEVADQMVFADVVGEEVDAWRAERVGGGEVVEVRAAEHVGFADDAGRDEDGVDGCVEFRVRGGEEEFFEAAAAAVDDGREESLLRCRLLGGVAGCAGRGDLRLGTGCLPEKTPGLRARSFAVDVHY